VSVLPIMEKNSVYLSHAQLLFGKPEEIVSGGAILS
jgi:hypothetical protein